MSQGIVNLQRPSMDNLVCALYIAAREAAYPIIGQADASEIHNYKLVLVCPQFTATPFKVVVDTETKQVEIHFDY